MKALDDKNKVLQRFKQSVENYKRVKAGQPKITKTVSDDTDYGTIDWNASDRQ
jgi:hypothetical protein